MTFGNDAIEWLSQSLGIPSQALTFEQMKGSTSSSVYLIQGWRDSAHQPSVLRVLDNQDWLAEEPDIIAHEAAALQEAQHTNLNAPKLVASAAHDVGFGWPVVLMSYLEGNVELCPTDFIQWVDNLASQLAMLHRHTAPGFSWHYVSWMNKALLKPPVWTTRPHIWERAIELALGPVPDYRPVFIHRDYHPTNVLWHKGDISGVVDWINACRGPAGVDVATSRINLAQMYGPEAADEFLDSYSEVADGFEYNPYWDVDSILDSCVPEPTFYRPWQEFGLKPIAQDTLRQRVDNFLERVMMRV